MDVETTVSLSPAEVDVVCVAPREKARAPSHIWTDRQMGVSCLSCRAMRRRSGTSIEKMPRTNSKAEVAVATEIALLRVRRQFSPWLFETSGRCHSIMPSLFILFIQCWKFNSFYSIINEWPQCRPTIPLCRKNAQKYRRRHFWAQAALKLKVSSEVHISTNVLRSSVKQNPERPVKKRSGNNTARELKVLENSLDFFFFGPQGPLSRARQAKVVVSQASPFSSPWIVHKLGATVQVSRTC